MGWLTVASGFLSALASVFNWAGKRSDLKNAPDVKAAKAAADEQKEVDRINNDVRKGDLSEIQKDIAE